jgi:hypothetical protein
LQDDPRIRPILARLDEAEQFLATCDADIRDEVKDTLDDLFRELGREVRALLRAPSPAPSRGPTAPSTVSQDEITDENHDYYTEEVREEPPVAPPVRDIAASGTVKSQGPLPPAPLDEAATWVSVLGPDLGRTPADLAVETARVHVAASLFTSGHLRGPLKGPWWVAVAARTRILAEDRGVPVGPALVADKLRAQPRPDGTPPILDLRDKPDGEGWPTVVHEAWGVLEKLVATQRPAR